MSQDQEALNVPNEETLSELFSRYTAQIMQIKEEHRARPRVSRSRALEQTHLLLKNFAPFQDKAKSHFQGEALQGYQVAWTRLPESVLVYYKADLMQEQPWEEQRVEQRQRLSLRVRQHDRRFTRWAEALFLDETVFSEAEQALLQAQIAQIKEGRGPKDDAEDTLRWGDLFLQHHAKALAIPYLKEADIKQAQQEARDLILLLSDNGQTPTQGSPHDLWWRSYTLWSQDYNQIADLGRFLAGNPTNADELFPKIHPERSKPKKA
jgi:hypothetical protein